MANVTDGRLSVMLALGLVGGAGLTLSSCKKKVEVGRNTGYIVGLTNDILPASGDTEARVDPVVVNGAALIATKLDGARVKFCSGSLIAPEADGGPSRVLTNHHCFAVAGESGKATEALMAEACVETKVYFGFKPGHGADSFVTACASGSLRTNFTGDLAVFDLQQAPPELYRPLQLWDGSESTEGRDALIVHYPDVQEQMEAAPGGEIRLPTAAITVDDCKVIGDFPVSEWDLDRTLPYSLRHTCDLIHGSSGSGLIDAETGKLLGVNWGGIKVSYSDETRTDNVATRADYAAAFLNGTIEEAVREADSRRASGNSLSAVKGSDSSSKRGSIADGVTKRCGVADVGPSGSLGSTFMLLLLLLPLGVGLRRKHEFRRQELRTKGARC